MGAFSRRTFLQAAGVGLAASAVAVSRRAKAAPGDRIRHAVIGVGRQGQGHVKRFAAQPDCEVVAVCDVDPERREEAAALLPDPSKVAKYEDLHKLLEDASIDSVTVATPDHWHTPAALWALKAGKHVYVEKPCCHNVREGQALVAAARKTGKCVQHGTQNRCGADRKEAVRFLREGGLGKVRVAKAINHQLREPIGRAPVEEPPAGVNYDLWLGPAPKVPFTRNRWHYEWHWFWDYGTGDLGNDAVHHVDLARWGLGKDWPSVITAHGGQLFYDDDHETPDTQTVVYDFGDCYLLYEMRLWTDYPLEGHDNAAVFYGDKGTLEIGREGCQLKLKGEPQRRIGETTGDPVRNFLDAVKANDPSLLDAPIDEGFVSASLCHLGNIGTRLGRILRYDAAKHECVGDEEATRMLGREYRAGYELPEV